MPEINIQQLEIEAFYLKIIAERNFLLKEFYNKNLQLQDSYDKLERDFAHLRNSLFEEQQVVHARNKQIEELTAKIRTLASE